MLDASAAADSSWSGRQRRAAGKLVMEGRISQQRQLINRLIDEIAAWRYCCFGCHPGKVQATAGLAFIQVQLHAAACAVSGHPSHSATKASVAAKDGWADWHRGVNARRHKVGQAALGQKCGQANELKGKAVNAVEVKAGASVDEEAGKCVDLGQCDRVVGEAKPIASEVRRACREQAFLQNIHTYAAGVGVAGDSHLDPNDAGRGGSSVVACEAWPARVLPPGYEPPRYEIDEKSELELPPVTAECKVQ